MVVGQVGEEGDAPVVGGNLDNVGGEAAGAAGVEEDSWGLAVNEPTSCIERGGSVIYWELETVQGGGEVDEAILLEGDDPFAEIGKGGIDAAVAFGCACDTLI